MKASNLINIGLSIDCKQIDIIDIKQIEGYMVKISQNIEWDKL